MKRVAFVGAGGINSWAIGNMNDIVKLYEQKQLIYIKIFDKDIVEEKNIKRFNQNFTTDDLMEKKAEALAKRYNFDFEDCFITEENINKLDVFDDVILGVDNHKTRKIIYKYCLEKHKFLLDLRANSTLRSWYIILPDDKRNWEYFEKLHFSNPLTMEKKGSCQLSVDIEKDHIESANKIVAYEGIWGLYLKRIRNEEYNTLEFKFAY